jgi:hypothetical protein
VEIGVPKQVDAGDGVLYHLRECIRDAERDEAGRGAETHRDVAHADDLQKGEADAEPHEYSEDSHHEVGDELFLRGVQPAQRRADQPENDLHREIRNQQKDESRHETRDGDVESVEERLVGLFEGARDA